MRRSISRPGRTPASTRPTGCASESTEYDPEVPRRPVVAAERQPGGSTGRPADHRYGDRREPQHLRPRGRGARLGRAPGEQAPHADPAVGDPEAPAAKSGRSLRSRARGGERAGAAQPRRLSAGARRHRAPAGRQTRAAGRDRGRLEHATAGELHERGGRQHLGSGFYRAQFPRHSDRAGAHLWPQSRPHSVETYGELAHERVLRFRDDVLLDSTSHRLFRVGLMAGIAAAATTHKYARIWGGWEWRREDFGATDSSRVPYSVFTTVRAGVELGAVRFRVLEHFNSYARREDVDLSPTLRAGIVLQSGVGYEFSGQTSAVWKRGFAVVRVAANGLDTTRTQAEVTVVSQDIPRHTWIMHAEGGVVTHPKPGAEFDPWMVKGGPRLFGIHEFTGTRSTWFVLEDRILVVDEILGLMALGLAPFLDYGGAWYRDEAARQGGDAGLSLRFGPTRAVRGEAVEVAFGYRFGQGVQGRRWAVTLRKGFSF